MVSNKERTKCRNYQAETRNKEEDNYIQQFSPIKIYMEVLY